jgi:glyceraldehyde-3-phosphate dehydrogenase (ferredoxin)
VEYAWRNRGTDDPTVLGIGPLARAGLPGAGGLVLAGRSPLWDGFYATTMAGGGTLLAAVGADMIAIRGRAPAPSVLVLARQAGSLQARVEQLDPEPLWRGTHDGEGLYGLLRHLLSRHGEVLSQVQVLAAGPAAASTRYGSLGVGRSNEGVAEAAGGWIGRGGFGSRLYQAHHLVAIVVGLDGEPVSPEQAELLPFRPDMSVAELEHASRYEMSPRLTGLGELGAHLMAVRHRLLWFNGTSVYLRGDQRDALYHTATRTHLLDGLVRRAGSGGERTACGEPCPIACKRVDGGRTQDPEHYLAFGPQLGVVEPKAAEQVITHCRNLGFDPLTVGAITGWQMERLHRRQIEPGYLGVHAAPRWSAADFAPEEDSRHNARLARDLAQGILTAPWGEPLREGLRHAAVRAGDSAASLAIYVSNGEDGEMPVAPVWSPGYFTPMPIPGEYHQYYGLDFVPPRVLGRKSGQRMPAELMLQNLGVCRLHRGWAEELLPELVNRALGTTTDWFSHHRALARHLFQRRKARFWETVRLVDVIASFLADCHHDAAPDPELDRWVRRFRQDRASAARAFWSEMNAGLEEILGG